MHQKQLSMERSRGKAQLHRVIKILPKSIHQKTMIVKMQMKMLILVSLIPI